MNKKTKIYYLGILAMMFITTSITYSVAIPPDLGPIILDPGDGSGGGSGNGFEFCRMWRFDYDVQDDEGIGVRKVFFEIIEAKSSDEWKITYKVLIDQVYWAQNDYDLKIERFNPYGNVWDRSWITEDDATITENWNNQDEYYRLYINEVYEYIYPYSYIGKYVGINGGLVMMDGDTGVICPYYGATLKFQLGRANYLEPYDWFWNDIDDHIYSFFGSEPAPTWCCHVLFPSGAWYSQY